MARCTFDDLLIMNTDVLSCQQAAEAMGMNPGRLIGYAREKPELVSFPYQLSGCRMKIPRIPFLRFWGFTDEQIKQKAR